MTLTEIFLIIIVHWVADFIFQDEKWALGKSKNWDDLFSHTIMYSKIWFMAICCYLALEADTLMDIALLFHKAMWFMIITFITHTATDYFTSRIVSKRFQEETIFNLKVSNDIFKEGDIIQDGADNRLIIMKHYGDESKVKLYNSIPNFGAFTIIGIDQVLHYVQLFLTFYFLI